MLDPILASLGLNEQNSGVYDTVWSDQPSGEERPSINPATGEISCLCTVRIGRRL